VIFGDFLEKNATYDAGIKFIAIFHIELITNNDYSPTNKSLWNL